jgi:hypothetical protein
MLARKPRFALGSPSSRIRSHSRSLRQGFRRLRFPDQRPAGPAFCGASSAWLLRQRDRRFLGDDVKRGESARNDEPQGRRQVAWRPFALHCVETPSFKGVTTHMAKLLVRQQVGWLQIASQKLVLFSPLLIPISGEDPQGDFISARRISLLWRNSALQEFLTPVCRPVPHCRDRAQSRDVFRSPQSPESARPRRRVANLRNGPRLPLRSFEHIDPPLAPKGSGARPSEPDGAARTGKRAFVPNRLV